MRKMFAILALLPGVACATPITYEFSGTVEYSESHGSLDTLTGIQIGTQFSGLFFYTPDTADCVTLQSGSLGCTGLTSFHMRIAGFDYYSHVDTSVDGASGINSTFMPVWAAGEGSELLVPHDFAFSVLNDSPTLGGNFRVRSEVGGDLVSTGWQAFRGSVASWTPVEVPEPGTLALLSLGLLGVLISARQRNREIFEN